MRMKHTSNKITRLHNCHSTEIEQQCLYFFTELSYKICHPFLASSRKQGSVYTKDWTFKTRLSKMQRCILWSIQTEPRTFSSLCPLLLHSTRQHLATEEDSKSSTCGQTQKLACNYHYPFMLPYNVASKFPVPVEKPQKKECLILS